MFVQYDHSQQSLFEWHTGIAQSQRISELTSSSITTIQLSDLWKNSTPATSYAPFDIATSHHDAISTQLHAVCERRLDGEGTTQIFAERNTLHHNSIKSAMGRRTLQ
jgi:hypothetical protein